MPNQGPQSWVGPFASYLLVGCGDRGLLFLSLTPFSQLTTSSSVSSFSSSELPCTILDIRHSRSIDPAQWPWFPGSAPLPFPPPQSIALSCSPSSGGCWLTCSFSLGAQCQVDHCPGELLHLPLANQQKLLEFCYLPSASPIHLLPFFLVIFLSFWGNEIFLVKSYWADSVSGHVCSRLRLRQVPRLLAELQRVT